MLLAIDMGNTNIVISCMDGRNIAFVERISTDISRTELEYAISFKMVFELHGIDSDSIDGAILSSVVPPLTNVISHAVEKITGNKPMIVGPGIKTGLNIHMDDPGSVGSDLIVGAVAAIERYGAPVTIIDLGTATTIAVIDRRGSYAGGIIIPGVRASLEALASSTSQLPKIGLDIPKHVIGKNTVDSMKSGIVLGNAAMIDGMIDRIHEELGYETNVVAAGGTARLIIPACKHRILIDDELLLHGLGIVYHKNH